MDMSLSKLWELVMDTGPAMLQSMGRKESDMTEQLNWTDEHFVKLLFKNFEPMYMDTTGYY